MNKLKALAIFTLGVAVGTMATYKFLKRRYEMLLNENEDTSEDDDIFDNENFNDRKEEETNKEKAYKNMNKPSISEYIKKDDEDEDEDEEDMDNYVNLIDDEEYKKRDEPYIISPDDIGERELYDIISLKLYENGVLTDDFDEPVIDVESTVGLDYVNHFGEYNQPDMVVVRNDRLMADFEICKVIGDFILDED